MISVIICTYNRSDYLELALRSLVKQENCTDFEVIIVDNNSTDSTKDICKKFIDRDDWNYFFEKSQGLSFARNRGIKEAKGEILAFLDDDAIANSNWIANIYSFFKNHPNADVLAGRVRLIEEKPIPTWVSKEMATITFAQLDYSDKTEIMPYPSGPVGANAIYRRKVFTDHNIRFPTNLGRVGNKLLSGEESEVLYHIHRAGLHVYYSPEVEVKHHASKDRIAFKYVLKRLYWEGRSRAIRWSKKHKGSHSEFCLHQVKDFLKFLLRKSPRLGVYENLIWFGYWGGMFLGLVKLSIRKVI